VPIEHNKIKPRKTPTCLKPNGKAKTPPPSFFFKTKIKTKQVKFFKILNNSKTMF